jgi:hypothetical protein
MSRLLRLGRRHFLTCIACALSVLALTADEARALSLTLTVTESAGGASVQIVDGGSLDLDPTIGVILVNTTGLNPLLANYAFTALGATSNAPGNVTQAVLTQNGTAQLIAGGGGGSINITASDVDFNLPSGPGGFLRSSASDTYTNSPTGDSHAFTSWFNPNNLINATQVASGTVTLTAVNPPNPNSHSNDATPTPVNLTIPYGLTSTAVLTLTGGTTALPSQIQYTGSTTISAIPEPASLALMLTAVPVTLFGALRRRKVTD